MKRFIKERIKRTSLYNRFVRIEVTQREILNGLIFNSTITDSEWLRYKNFSPGRMAVDYGFLYTLYSVLNSMKPKAIIEFGLGQSSKMVHQYANYFHVNAITYEHDSDWMSFFNEGKDGEYDITACLTELETIEYKGYETLTYKDIDKKLAGKKFDFVVVDGPFGSPHYSRSEIVGIAKDNLKERFCILIDDTGRVGEKEIILEIVDVLESNHIDFYMCTYESLKNHTLICSADMKFLTSL